MRGREFLDLAQELLSSGTHPRHWRGVVVHAYYALLLECRDAMTRWGLPPLTRQLVHAQVRLRLVYAADADLKWIGFRLEELSKDRNLASYDLRSLPAFASSITPRQDVQRCANAMVRLDAIDKDPGRRAAAVASIRP
jgi:hypothetical protein